MRTGSPLPGLGPQILAKARRVVLDDGVGRVEDVAVGAVVLLQADQVGDMELALEVGHVAHLGATEGVDGLIVIPHAKQVGATAGQQLQPLVLQLVGVLKLIDQNVAEALLVMPAQRLVALQQFVGAQQQLGEIDHAFALALRLVGLVELDALSRPVVPGFDRGGRRPCSFCALMKWHSSRGGNFSSSTFSDFSRRLTAELVGRVEDLEQLRQAGIAMVGAQQAVAQAVEGADPHAAHVDRQHGGQPRHAFPWRPCW
jgi:hypothetical protein